MPDSATITATSSIDLVFLAIAVLLFVVIVLQYMQIQRLQCYLMSKQDPGAYITSTMQKAEFGSKPPSAPTEDDLDDIAIREYSRMILTGTATATQINAHEAMFGVKEDVLA